jgi:hypothetical protein
MMTHFFKCPRDLLRSPLFEAEKPVSPGLALLVVVSQAAYGTYRFEAEDGSVREIRPGQFAVNIERLQRLTGWTEARLTRFLFHLHEHGVLDREHWHGHTIATLRPEALAELPPLELKRKKPQSQAAKPAEVEISL